MTRISSRGIRLLKSFEELRTEPYNDENQEPITEWVDGATIGWGHLIRESEWNEYKNGITEKEADSLLRQDLQRFNRVARRR